jgi:hypothetical protein
MSLEVNANKIIIHNSAGVEKFNSSQRLLYQIGYASGVNVSLNSSTFSRAIAHGLTYDPTKDIATAFITITSCSNGSSGGTIGTYLIGQRIPVQGMVPIDFYARNVSNRPAIDGSWITSYVNSEYLFLGGNHCAYDVSSLRIPNPINFSVVLNWEVFVYRYTT